MNIPDLISTAWLSHIRIGKQYFLLSHGEKETLRVNIWSVNRSVVNMVNRQYYLEQIKTSFVPDSGVMTK